MPTQTDQFDEFMQSIIPNYKSPIKKELTKDELEQLNKALPKKPKTYLEALQNSENPYSSEYYKKVAEERIIQKEADKKARVEDRTKRVMDDEFRRKNKSQKEETWREMLYNDVNASDAKYRISQEDNIFDDYINPLAMIGSMTRNLGQAPLIAKETNSNKPYLTSIGIPLAVGVMGGIGSKTSLESFNNIINPLAPFKSNIRNNVKVANTGDDISKVVDYSYNKPGLINKEELSKLREELAKNGILKQQKTINWPWKNAIDKGIEPWGYDGAETTLYGSRIKDIYRTIVDGKNPNYISKEEYIKMNMPALKDTKRILKEEVTDDELEKILISSYNEQPKFYNKFYKKGIEDRYNKRYNADTKIKNRYSTWEMYLGKPQTKNPMYDVSPLTAKTNDVVYTIKPEYMNQGNLNYKFYKAINSIENVNLGKALKDKEVFKKLNENEWINIDVDAGYFGTMGGFNWKAKKLNNGNYEFIASDVWDLHPFKKNNKLGPLKNIEVGKALGIGKPLNVKVGFEVDANTRKIIKTFGIPAAVMSSEKLLDGEEQ